MSSDVASFDRNEASNWKLVTLGKILRIVTDGITAADLSALPNVHHYSLPAFDVGAGPEIGPGEMIKSNKTIVPDDCVLFSKLNPRIPRIWRVSGAAAPHSYCSTEFWPLVAQGRSVDLDYLTQYLGSDGFLGHPSITPASSTNSHQRVDRKAFERFEFMLPPLDEQRRIAGVLRSVDDAIAAKRVALAASKLFKRTCREAAVARFRHYIPNKLQSVLATIGAGWSPDCESEPANDGEWSILKTSAVVWEGYDDQENKRLPAHLEPRPHLEVVADDILVTRAGPAERTGVIATVRKTVGRRMLSDKIIRLRVDRKKAVPLAIAELLSSDHVQAEVIRSKSGMAASQTNISQKIVLGLEMHLPPLSEQRDFAEEMAALQDAIETSEADLQTALELKAALMSDLLSGHVRVPA